MCKTNVKTNFYYTNICKYEHDKNVTRLWCKIMPKIDLLNTLKGLISIYTPLGS